MSESRLELVWSNEESGSGGPFDALLEATESDPDAARGLALAYASMSREERAGLVESIVRDAASAGRSPAGPLALLLAVEEDETLAHRIVEGLDDTLERRGVDAGYRWGDADEGGVAVVRHLHGGFVEVIRLTWRGGELDIESDPLARGDEAELRRRHGVPEDAVRLALPHAVDEMAQALWRARRGGARMPERMRAFAHLFSVSPNPLPDAQPARFGEPRTGLRRAAPVAPRACFDDADGVD